MQDLVIHHLKEVEELILELYQLLDKLDHQVNEEVVAGRPEGAARLSAP